MVKAGSGPANYPCTESVEFCERVESIEQMLGLIINKTAAKNAGTTGQQAEGRAKWR